MTDPALLGKRYDGGVFTVDAADAVAYADATDDPCAAYREPGGVAPPMFHVRALIELMMTCATDRALGIDLLRLVHGEHSMRFLRPLRHGDQLSREAELVEVAAKDSGTLYSFALRGAVDGVPALDGRTTYFVRAPRRPSEAKRPRPAPEAPPAPTWTATQQVSEDQATRYAAASGDHNPIHLDAAVARAAGLPGVILHGLCTLAFAQRDLIARSCAGDPTRLAALGVRFAAPVFPGQRLTLEVVEPGDGTIAFRTLNPDGRAVLTHGTAEVR